MNEQQRRGIKIAKHRAIERGNAEARARQMGIVIPDEIEYSRPGAAGDDLVRIMAKSAVKPYACGGCGEVINAGELYAFVKSCTGGQWEETRLCGKCGMARLKLENSKG